MKEKIKTAVILGVRDVLKSVLGFILLFFIFLAADFLFGACSTVEVSILPNGKTEVHANFRGSSKYSVANSKAAAILKTAFDTTMSPTEKAIVINSISNVRDVDVRVENNRYSGWWNATDHGYNGRYAGWTRGQMHADMVRRARESSKNNKK